DPKIQELVRVTRLSESEFRQEDLADVRFVPLIGKEGWGVGESLPPQPTYRRARSPGELPEQIAEHCEPFESLETSDLKPVLERIGEARMVLLGEATHGTSEFYRMR